MAVRQRYWFALALATWALASIGSRAHGQPASGATDDYINPDRPGIADGSNVISPGHFQIETGVQRELREEGEDHRLFVPTLLRLGLSDRWEARVEGNIYTWETTSVSGGGSGDSDGFAPISIGMKYHLVDSKGLKQPSVGAILRIFPPSGSGAFRTRHATGDFRVTADWDLASKWSLNPNVGVAVYEDDANRMYAAGLFAATLNFNPSKVLNLFVDTGIQTPETKGGSASLIYDAGIAYVIGHDVQLDFSVGSGGAGRTPPHPFLSAGISKRF